jgi:hypothetical protein
LKNGKLPPGGTGNWSKAFLEKLQIGTLREFFSNIHTTHIRMAAGSTEVIETERTLVAEACNHPNCLVLPFSFPMVRLAA